MPCTTILVGKGASIDGSTIIARNDDGGFEAKKILVNKACENKKAYKSVLSHVSVELPEKALRYTSAPNVIKKDGLWPACGINELNVAMTATETLTSNPRVLGADPYVEYKPRKGNVKAVPGGIGEEDLLTLVLPYIRSAREGVLRLGKLLEQYGTYEPNGIAFSDINEIWWLETIGGHHWIAQRVPDDAVVIMPNQFGMDRFDFEDAYGEQKAHLCSADLLAFTENNQLYAGREGQVFNPRLAYGSRSDADHIYNTPRAWFMARYFLERSFRWDGENADFTPESNDIPWCLVPEHKVSIEEVRYLLGSYYQGTPYNPYDASSPKKGRYRTIGVPNSDVCGILQLRGYLPEAIQALEWLSMGGSGFTACFPLYTNVDDLPAYLSATTESVSTNHMYWHSRLIAALTDAHYGSAIILDERYQNAVLNKTRQILCDYDAKLKEGGSPALLKEANRKITECVQKESDKALAKLLRNASEHMKIRYHRGDN